MMRACFLLLVFCFVARVECAEVSPIRIRVEQVAENESDKHKHNQKIALKVFLSNSGSADASNLTVKYAYFGRDLENDDISVVERGERKATVAGLGSAVVETGAATTVYTDEHGERAKKGAQPPTGGKRRKNVRYKTAEATGTKITGYGVQVFAGRQLVAEAYSGPSLKEQMK